MFFSSPLRACAGLLVLLLLTSGCYHRTAEQIEREVEEDQLVLNEFADADMDVLHERLRQHLDQFPRWEGRARPGAAGKNWLASLKKASRRAEAGEFDAAARQLAEGGLDPPDPRTLARARAVVDALRFHRDEVTPLAARAAAFVLLSGRAAPVQHAPTGVALLDEAPALAAEIRHDLRHGWAWAWKFEGAKKVGIFPAADGKAPGIALYSVQGYRNMDLPGDVTITRRRLEHYHFAVFVNLNRVGGGMDERDRQYLQSYALLSKELYGGERIYFLEQLLAGSLDILEVYDTLPSYHQVAAEVCKRLE